MARTFSATSNASPETMWRLIAEPAHWSGWAPHVRGAWGLGKPEVQERRFGAARLFGFLPVPARIIDKRDGESWTWRVGPLTLAHSVTAITGGSKVSMTLSAPGPLEPLLAATYGQVVDQLVRRLAIIASASSTNTSP